MLALIMGKWLIVSVLVEIALIFAVCASASWRGDPAFIMHCVNCVLKPARNVRRSVKITPHIMLPAKLVRMLAGNARKRAMLARNLLAAVE